MSKGEQPTPQPHGDLDYYFKLRRGDVEPRYQVKTREEEIAEYEEKLRANRNGSIQSYGDRGVYVPNGMTAAEIVEGANVLQKELDRDWIDMGHYRACEIVCEILRVIRPLGPGSGETPAPLPPDQKDASRE